MKKLFVLFFLAVGLMANAQRSFVDFKVDFRSDPYTVALPADGTLPTGVVIAGTFHDAQHGYNQTTITVPVDGPVKFTFGCCNYGSNATISDENGVLATVNCKSESCDTQTSSNVNVTWTYNSTTPATLTIVTGTYIPYFYAEACEAQEEPAEFADFELDFVNVSALPAKPACVTSMTGSARGDAHGLDNFNMVLDVPGAVKITFGGCQFSSTTATIKNGDVVLGTVDVKTPGCYHNGGTATWQSATDEPMTLTIVGAQYTPYIKVERINLDPAPFTPEVTTDPEQTQVWDFGAEQFTGVKNMLSVNEINSWYADTITPGTSNIQIGDIKNASDSVNFYYDYNGKANGRLRTTNTAITRYDSKSLTDANNNVYTGYLYSNTSSTAAVYVRQAYKANDKLTFALGSNGGAATYHLVNAEAGYDETFQYTAKNKIELATFYIPEDGNYQLYCANEKLVLARITRVPATYVAVSGNITAPAEMPASYRLVFTCVETGAVQEAVVAAGAYSTVLAQGYTYNVGIARANGFAISTAMPVAVNGTTTQDFTIEAIPQVTATGAITGLPDGATPEFSFAIPAGHVYMPEMTVANGQYTLVMEEGVRYAITVDGVNDYELAFDTIGAVADTTFDFAFAPKALHTVTILPNGATADDLAAAVFTYTNINEEGYVYTFTGTTAQLRDGVYSVVGSNLGDYGQMLTANLTVAGADINFPIDFETGFSAWNFADPSWANGGYKSSANETNYRGLLFTLAQVNKNYMLLGNGATIKVPVAGACKVQVSSCYEAHFGAKVGDSAIDTLRDAKSGSTSQIDVDEYTYTATEAGYVTIVAWGSSYLTAINIVYPATPYQATITVGQGKEFATICEALEAVRKMDRDAATQRVTLLIEPGNYEEMPTVDVANITFRNASATPSIATLNAGVDIDDEAVRITGYYGHGYNYYSMNSKYGWDERTLAVNKQNGYASTSNPGGSPARLWNSTTLITAPGFEAYDIIFENSYNQYISAKEADDVVVDNGSGKGVRPTTVGSTDVQQKKFIERASAIGFNASADRAYFKNCRFIGHQDVVYGDQGARVAIDGGILQGGTDYIFGGMTLVVYKADIAINVSDDKNDVAYITASKNNTASPRGYLFANCHVRSVTPLVEMACATSAKPAYWGRPWDANAETVVIGTAIDETKDPNYSGSMIAAAGWNNGLVSSGSPNTFEAFNFQEAQGVTYDSRVAWATILTEAKLPNGLDITLFNWTKGNDNWDPFQGAEINITVNPYEQTAIQDTNADDTDVRKFIMGGQLIIERNGVRYNALGQIVR